MALDRDAAYGVWFVEVWDAGDGKGAVSTCTNRETGERRVIAHENTAEGIARLWDMLEHTVAPADDDSPEAVA